MSLQSSEKLSQQEARIRDLESEVEYLSDRVMYWRERAETAVVKNDLNRVLRMARRAKAGNP